MKFGLVSNCWKRQLESGASLLELIREAHSAGFAYIELRQTCLGEFEDSFNLPIAESAALLRESCPEMEFNLAVSAGVFQGEVDAELLKRSIEFCKALDADQPHIRFVDLVTTASVCEELSPATAAEKLVQLVESIPPGFTVSLEHSIQPWNWFWQTFIQARQRVDSQLQLCLDPCNLVFAGDQSNLSGAMGAISDAGHDVVSMLHVKQHDGVRVMDRIADGWPDWTNLAQKLAGWSLSCPVLFEFAESDEPLRPCLSARRILENQGI